MSAPVHMAHETGAWSLGVAAAFLAVAAAPALAAGALPFLGTFTALLVPVTLADLGAGHVPAARAAVHLLLLVGLVLVATVAWRGRRRRVAAVAAQRASRRVPA
jgi:predicted anti-sigma-YlaC factor YlaD